MMKQQSVKMSFNGNIKLYTFLPNGLNERVVVYLDSFFKFLTIIMAVLCGCPEPIPAGDPMTLCAYLLHNYI